MTAPWLPEFLFVVCQVGAEAALKRDVARRAPAWKLAFSRPGLVTFKLPEPVAAPARFEWHSPLARTSGFSLGQVQGERLKGLAELVWQLPQVVACGQQVDLADVHAWQRDAAVPGTHGFEPGPTPLSEEVRQAVLAAAPPDLHRVAWRPAARNSWTLDVVLTEPHQWLIGCHQKTTRVATWPGGVPPLARPEGTASRAYLKMGEALLWSALPIVPGEVVVELGCAPGGAAQALLDCGFRVVGVDPAAVGDDVESHPRFTHVRRRTRDVPKHVLADARWLCADMNVAPQYVLDAVEEVVRSKCPALRGMLLTFKLASWDLLDRVPEYLARIRSWGFRDVRVRQLAFNAQELCVAVLRSRAQRRVIRAGKSRTPTSR